MKKKLLSILLLGVLIIGLTGCGTSSNISEKLNEIVNDSVSKWEKDGYAHTFSFSDIQDSLNKKGYKYTIIASGNKEFTSAVTLTKYSEKLDNYSGNLYSSGRMLEKDMEVNYCLVLDVESGNYYSVSINYKTTDLNGAKKEYPYFEDETLLK